jgi:hypothetical protein
MHEMLLRTAIGDSGEGTPCSVVVDHIATDLDYDAGQVTFQNGVVITADLIIGADGIRVRLPALLFSYPIHNNSDVAVCDKTSDWRGTRDPFSQSDLLPMQC